MDGVEQIRWTLDDLVETRWIGTDLTADTPPQFLVNKEGKVVGRFGSSTTPASLKTQIEKVLAA